MASIHIEMPSRLAAIWIALLFDFIGPVLLILFIRTCRHASESLRVWMDKSFKFYPASNIEHSTERTKAFVTLVLGYSVVAIIYQSASSFGINAFFGKATLGLIQAFCVNWLYFELHGADLFVHAIRRNVACGESIIEDWIVGYTKSKHSIIVEIYASPIHHELCTCLHCTIQACFGDGLRRYEN